MHPFIDINIHFLPTTNHQWRPGNIQKPAPPPVAGSPGDAEGIVLLLSAKPCLFWTVGFDMAVIGLQDGFTLGGT